MDEPVLRRAKPDELDVVTLYAVLRLRVEVFVVEQACPYPELDGRDLDPSTVHFWLSPHGAPTAVLGYLRLLRGGDTYRIGRVCTARSMRGAGLADVLMRAALQEVGDAPCALESQSHLVGFYTTHGFHVAGEEFIEDGIPHVPMRRDPSG
ncbi:MAG TPA: GNAT family N-acetyltransferase [Pseudonocardiaceae bacterium]|jgi:ElaA protein